MAEVRLLQRLGWVLTRCVCDHKKELIIVAGDTLPLPDQESGGLRMSLILKGLAKAGKDIVFVSLKDKSALPGNLQDTKRRLDYEHHLYSWGVKKIIYGVADFRNFLERRGSAITFALVAFPHVAASLFPIMRLHAPNAKLAYDMVDFHTLRLRREAELTGSQVKLSEGLAMEKLERAVFAASDLIFAVSQAELELVREYGNGREIQVLGNAFSTRSSRPPGPFGRRNIVFLGGFWHSPNLDAVQWFVENVWPLVRKSNPKVEFHIAGSNMDDRVYALEAVEGVRILGYIKELDPFFDKARVFIAPLRFGAGMKGKVGQSMAYGLPVVSTSIGAEGMNITVGQDYLLANDPESMALAVADLLQDDAKWLSIQTNALNYIKRDLSPENIDEVLRLALNSETNTGDRRAHC